MNRKILILNPPKNAQGFYGLIEYLDENDFKLLLLGKNKFFLKKFRENGWPIAKMNIPRVKSRLAFWTAIILMPLYAPFLLFFLMMIKYRRKTRMIICFSLFEQILLTPLSALLKIRIIWLKMPGGQAVPKGFFYRILIKITSRYAKILVFSKYCQKNIKAQGCDKDNINIINPAVKTGKIRQDSMFSRLAQNIRKDQLNKFFTIGTILELNNQPRLETVFKATKKILNVIPNLQIIIIGDGEDRKNLAWLTKKMGIGNLVWFVGEQQYISRWLENIDVYIVSACDPGLIDIQNTLKAMENFIPVVAPEENIWPEIIKNNINGILVDKFNSDNISSEVIGLKKNSAAKKYLGQNARETVGDNYQIDISGKKLISHLIK